MKIYNKAPLPFMGQKRKFLTHFREALKGYPATGVYVDLFGGSGLLGHTVKRMYPGAKVIFNDFDNYTQRIKAISKTNKIIQAIREIVKGLPDNKQIKNPHRQQIIDLIAAQKGYVDYYSISSSILFSMKHAKDLKELKTCTLYNTVRQSDYDATGYLDGLDVIKMDYRQAFERYKGADTVYLIDPPYLSTDCSAYTNYWRLTDYLDVLDTLRAGNFFYFTSNKISIIELCEWVATKTGGRNPFAGATMKTVNTNVNYSSSYTDIMLFKCQSIG